MATCHECGMQKSSGMDRCRGCGAGPSRLSDMEFDEISFVPGGANQKAHVAMWKSEQRVPIWKMDYGKRLGTGLAELRRQEAIAKADVEDGPVAFDPVTPSYSLMQAGYPQEVRKVFEADHAVYDDMVVAKAGFPSEDLVGLTGYAESMVDNGQAATMEQAVRLTLARDPRLYDAMLELDAVVDAEDLEDAS
jgi:hypothetical protein